MALTPDLCGEQQISRNHDPHCLLKTDTRPHLCSDWAHVMPYRARQVGERAADAFSFNTDALLGSRSDVLGMEQPEPVVL